MKNIFYLFITFLSLVVVSGCGDINEFTPTVTNPNANWSLTHIRSFGYIEDLKTDTLYYTIDESNNTIEVHHRFEHDAKATFGTVGADIGAKVTIENNNTNNIFVRIVYYEHSPNINTMASQTSFTKFVHKLNYTTKGMGTGAKIAFNFSYDYNNPYHAPIGSNGLEEPKGTVFKTF